MERHGRLCSSVTALVRFTTAVARAGQPYADTRLPWDRLHLPYVKLFIPTEAHSCGLNLFSFTHASGPVSQACLLTPSKAAVLHPQGAASDI